MGRRVQHILGGDTGFSGDNRRAGNQVRKRNLSVPVRGKIAVGTTDTIPFAVGNMKTDAGNWSGGIRFIFLDS